MKKKLLALLMGIAIMAIGGATLAACAPKDDSGSALDEAYSIYYASAEDNGETPLSYEEWLASIKGEVGDKGDTGTAGKSAYEIWLDMGNSGSEADFINWIKGESGKDSVYVIKVTTEQTNIDGDTFTIYRFTLSDGTVISKLLGTTPTMDNSGISSLSLSIPAVFANNSANPESNVIITVEYANTAKYITLADVEIIGDKPDFTTAGTYEVIMQYEGHYDLARICVTDENAVLVQDLNYNGYRNLWFAQDSVEANLVDLEGMNYTSEDGYMFNFDITPDMIGNLPTNTTEGATNLKVSYGDLTENLPIYVLNTTREEYLAANAAGTLTTIQRVELNTNTVQHVLIGQDACVEQSISAVVHNLFDTADAIFRMPLTSNMLVNSADSSKGYDSTTTGEKSYNLSQKIGGKDCQGTLTVNVHAYSDITAVDEIMCDNIYYNIMGGAVVHTTTSASEIPDLDLEVVFEIGAESGIYITEAINLRDTSKVAITNTTAVDFTVPRYYQLQLRFHGVPAATTESDRNLRVLLMNPVVNSVVNSSSFHIMDGGNYTYNSLPTLEAIKNDVCADIVNRSLIVAYVDDAADGQIMPLRVVTEKMLNFDYVDPTRSGIYTVYASFGEGANKVTASVATVTIDTCGGVAGVLYVDSNNVDYYSYWQVENPEDGSLSGTMAIVDEMTIGMGTYVATATELVITTGLGTMHYTKTGETNNGNPIIVPKEVTSPVLETYYEYTFEGDVNKVEVHADYITYSVYDSSTTSYVHQYTFGSASLKDGYMCIYADLLYFRSDGTITRY